MLAAVGYRFDESREVTVDAASGNNRHVAQDQCIRAVGLGVASVYVFWNLWWFGQGRPAPSLFTGLTGLPCPTTGGTRSLQALCQGDVFGSLYYNPMTMPILALLAVTVCVLAGRALRRERVTLPTGFLYAWSATLLIAWVIKFASPAATW